MSARELAALGAAVPVRLSARRLALSGSGTSSVALSAFWPNRSLLRLALGYNIITRLPDNFAQLSRLRYLNIRANMISQFPQVVGQRMPVLRADSGLTQAALSLSFASSRRSRFSTSVATRFGSCQPIRAG